MTLPAPDLDDRRFQDLVDDAKRMIALRCPEWTDHNVSDPGVAVIEAAAFMMDELFYRLNRVPERTYLSFLDLIGLELHPPAAATADVLFWLSAPRPETVVVPAGTEVATPRVSAAAIVFATARELEIPPRSLARLGTQSSDGPAVEHPLDAQGGAGFAAFSPLPKPGDSVLFGLDEAAPGLAVSLHLNCPVRGVGVDPLHPPLRWEAWDGAGWAACDLVEDGTGGLNRPGDVVLVVPATHLAAPISGVRAGWLRCVVTEPTDFPFYAQSPLIVAATAATVGGVTDASHAEHVDDELLGLSEGVPGQVFELSRHPVLADDGLAVQVGGGSDWQDWAHVDDFAGAGPDDKVVHVDFATGVVSFGPAVREADGTLRRYGAVPPKGAPLRVRRYRVGGGSVGNVMPGAISLLRGTVPFVRGVTNRRSAQGGADAETVEQAKRRAPIALRTRDRAVTVEDYEQLARRSAPGIARVRCVPADAADPGAVRLLVVPSGSMGPDGTRRFGDLSPDQRLLDTMAAYLDERRPVGSRLAIEPPRYRGVTVVARLVAKPRTVLAALQREAVGALNRYFDPISGGPDGEGWPFGRPVNEGDVYAALQALPGAQYVEDVWLFKANPITGEREEPTKRLDRIELEPGELVFSYEHQVQVREGR